MLLSLLLSVALTGEPTAQSPPPPQSEIVVQGVRSRERQIHDFVGALTPAPLVTGQLGRFDWEACPGAVGLSDAQNAAIVDRLRAVAIAAGVSVSKPGCRPNALVIVTSDKMRFLKALRRQYPNYFADLFGRPGIVPKQSGPATAWHVVAMVDHNGRPAATDLLRHHFISSSMDSSRLQPSIRPHFMAGIMVVEAKSLTGLSTTQLADYAAMRIFAKTDPERAEKTAAPTILSVLDAPMGSPVPVTMTAWDLAFLKGLYLSGERQYANGQRNEIERSVAKTIGDTP